ncbi:MAG: hypothetical protein V9E94_04810 [Microthrixaceae bacterium]
MGAAGLSTFYGYDAAGRQTVVRDPSGVETWTVRDARGNVVTEVGPVAVARTCGATSCSFGATPPTGPTTTYTYDRTGSLLSITDPANKVTTFSEDYPSGGGRVETVTAPPHRDDPGSSSTVQTSTVRTFDRFDRLVEEQVGDLSDPLSMSSTVVSRDRLGRVAVLSRTVGGSSGPVVTSFAYDVDGNQTVTAMGGDPSATDRQESKKVFDLRGRLIEEWGPTGDTSAPTSVSGSTPTAVRHHAVYVYDNADRLVSVRAGDGNEAQQIYYRYDVAGRLRYEIRGPRR